ncbi:MAG: hypothetical protein JRH01_26450 [Deltaproteobacteria bacterium]|nr:hypothetical protein [Deltaproteobacteria bacterium]
MKRVNLISLVVAVAALVLAGAAQAGSKKAYVCHEDGDGKRKTLKISESAVPAHEGHGDFVGTCSDAPPPPSEVVLMRCLADELETPITVSSLSATEGAPEIVANSTYGQGDSCAASIAALLDDGFALKQVLGDDEGGLATFYVLDR